LSGTAPNLVYTPTAEYNGQDSFTFTVTDKGDPDTCGPVVANVCTAALTSPAATVSITVVPVNDVPSFTKGADQTVLEDVTAQTVPAWATAISAGPANEASQTLNFLVSNNNNPLFLVQPAVAPNGTLTYTPAPNVNGTATITVSLHDSGGIADGGVDTSDPQTFTIAVTAVNDAPSFTKGVDQ